MPQWFLPYTAAALVAAALVYLGTGYDPDAGSQAAKPVFAATQSGKPHAQTTAQPVPAPAGAAPAPAPAPGPAPSSEPATAPATAPADAGALAAVRRVVRLSLTTDRAVDCARFYTQDFHNQMRDEDGAAAIEDCRDEADGEADAKRVVITSLRPSPAGYDVTVAASGGDMGNTSLTVSVVQEGGLWKLDQITGIDMDMARFAEIVEEEFGEEGYSSEESACMADIVAETDPAVFERYFIRGRADAFFREAGAQGLQCLSASTLYDQLAKGIREHAGGAPAPIVECIIDHVLGGKSAEELRTLVRGGFGPAAEAGREAAEQCIRMAGSLN